MSDASTGRTLTTDELAAPRSDTEGEDDFVNPGAEHTGDDFDRNRQLGEERRPGDDTARAMEDDRGPLLPSDDARDFSGRWSDVQSTFVDEPREAVAAADSLVAELMQRLAAMFAAEREELETQWRSGDDVSTEDLRLALRRYRSFFNRLLAT